jgi:hypothetical protein
MTWTSSSTGSKKANLTSVVQVCRLDRPAAYSLPVFDWTAKAKVEKCPTSSHLTREPPAPTHPLWPRRLHHRSPCRFSKRVSPLCRSLRPASAQSLHNWIQAKELRPVRGKCILTGSAIASTSHSFTPPIFFPPFQGRFPPQTTRRPHPPPTDSLKTKPLSRHEIPAPQKTKALQAKI